MQSMQSVSAAAAHTKRRRRWDHQETPQYRARAHPRRAQTVVCQPSVRLPPWCRQPFALFRCDKVPNLPLVWDPLPAVKNGGVAPCRASLPGLLPPENEMDTHPYARDQGGGLYKMMHPFTTMGGIRVQRGKQCRRIHKMVRRLKSRRVLLVRLMEGANRPGAKTSTPSQSGPKITRSRTIRRRSGTLSSGNPVGTVPLIDPMSK